VMVDRRERIERLLQAEELRREDLEELQPYDVAVVLPDLEPERQIRLLILLPPDVAAGALEHLDADDQYAFLVERLPVNTTHAVLAAMSTAALVDLLKALHPRQQQAVLRLVPPADVEDVRALMAYPEGSAASRMTTEYLAVRAQWSADQVIRHFRHVGRDVEIAHYVYVVDRAGKLIGVTSLRDVLLAEPEMPVADFMHASVVSVQATADQEEAARILRDYDFGALPVVDAEERLVGVLGVDDVLDVAEEEATEDIQKGASVVPLDTTYSRASVWSLYYRRVGWLAILVLLNLFSSAVIAAYSSTLAAVLSLAFFIPLLIGSGGNAGSQSATLMIRALATQDVRPSQWATAFAKEVAVGALLGLTLGALSALLGVFRGGWGEAGWTLGLVVGITMVAIVVVANLIGMTLPFLLSRFKLDPAVASSPLITTIADATGLLIYFSIAAWLFGIG